MLKVINMKSRKSNSSATKQGRFAGLLYLIIICCGLFSELFVRSTMIVPGNANETAQNIINNISLFKVGFAADIIMVICDIAVAVIFYLLLREVNKGLALAAAFFRLVQAAIIGMNLLHHFAAALLLEGAPYLSAIETSQINAQAMFFLNMHSYGYLISGVFFGMSCMVLGILFYRSAFFPKFLGVMLVAASIGYLTDCFVNFLAPQLGDLSEVLVLITAVTTELVLCIWLLIFGVRVSTKKTLAQ